MKKKIFLLSFVFVVTLFILSVVSASFASAACTSVVWNNTFDYHPSQNFGYAITLDKDNNAIIVGDTGEPHNIVLIKYSPSGSLLWFKEIDGSGDTDHGYGVATDASGNIYVVGDTYSSAIGTRFWILKYAANGNYLWDKTIAGPSNIVFGRNVAVDKTGDYIYVTGYVYNSGTYYDLFTMKYDKNGNQIWSKTYAGAGYDDRGWDIAVDSNGDVIILNRQNMGLVKYNSGGSLIWSKDSTDMTCWGYGLALDKNDNIYITGEAVVRYKMCVVKTNSFGDVAWSKTFGGVGSEAGLDIALDNKTGDVYISGVTNSFGGVGGNYWLVKLDQNGNMTLNATFDKSDQDLGYGLALDNNGGIYMTGYSGGQIWTIKSQESSSCRFPPPPCVPSTEVCDNIDNDCDGSIDESLTNSTGCSQIGFCAGSSKTCSAATWSSCSKTPQTEICDNIDNNCDGNIDEDLTNSSDCIQIGYCLGSSKTCINGLWSQTCNKVPQPEICSDGVDNKCDGEQELDWDSQVWSNGAVVGYGDQSGKHGDENCKVQITGISIEGFATE